MKRILSSLIVAATIYFVACNVEEETISQTRELPTKNPYAISIPQAIERLNAIFPDATKTTRATAADVATLTRGDFGLTTRAVNGALPTDPLIYIIPTDNNGCAIVGADERMEAVYAVLDNSTLTAEDILGIETRSDSQNEEDGEEIKEFVSTMLNDAITYNLLSLESSGDVVNFYHYTYNPIDKFGPLLKTKWEQGLPYSIAYPIQFGGKTGCAPLAAAQILYFLRHPNRLISTTYNWETISLFEYFPYIDVNEYTLVQKRMVSQLIYDIAVIMEAAPVQVGSNSSTIKVGVDLDKQINVFKRTRFESTCEDITYDSLIVKSMLMDSLPVFTYSHPSLEDYSGHAWVIDGYSNMVKTTRCMAIPSFIREDTIEYVHCNYGGRGVCDGYYQHGIFDLRIERDSVLYELEKGDSIRNIDANFSQNVRIIKLQ